MRTPKFPTHDIDGTSLRHVGWLYLAMQRIGPKRWAVKLGNEVLGFIVRRPDGGCAFNSHTSWLRSMRGERQWTFTDIRYEVENEISFWIGSLLSVPWDPEGEKARPLLPHVVVNHRCVAPANVIWWESVDGPRQPIQRRRATKAKG